MALQRDAVDGSTERVGGGFYLITLLVAVAGEDVHGEAGVGGKRIHWAIMERMLGRVLTSTNIYALVANLLSRSQGLALVDVGVGFHPGIVQCQFARQQFGGRARCLAYVGDTGSSIEPPVLGRTSGRA